MNGRVDGPAIRGVERVPVVSVTLVVYDLWARAGVARGPRVIVEWREELARLAVEGERRREPAPRRRPSRPPRRYSDREISSALALVADGKTLREAGAAVGVPHTTVMRWLRTAA